MHRISLSKALPPIQSSIGTSRWAATTQLHHHALAATPARNTPIITSRTHNRHFSSSPTCLKKSGKVNRAQAKTDSSPPVEGAARGTAVDDAYDLSELESSILKSMEKLTHELSQLRAGGRFNPEKIESLKVTLQDGGEKRTERLGDLAQVIAKGRNVQVLVHDEAFVKPVNTAIVTSALNLTPHGPTPEQPTTLTIQVPPPTGESRIQAAEAAKREEEAALGRIREARGKHQKKLRAFGVAKSVRPDDLQKAQKLMEDAVKRGNEDVKRVVDDARRVLERG